MSSPRYSIIHLCVITAPPFSVVVTPVQLVVIVTHDFAGRQRGGTAVTDLKHAS
jgi:hypothetical protein